MITDWTITPCTLSSNHTVLWSQAKRTKVFSVDTFMGVTVIFVASSACNMQHCCSAALDVNVHDHLVQSAGKCVMVEVASSRSVMNLCISPFFYSYTHEKHYMWLLFTQDCLLQHTVLLQREHTVLLQREWWMVVHKLFLWGDLLVLAHTHEAMEFNYYKTI